LAFRALPEQAVANDLRYWPESNMTNPPEKWEMFARLPAELLHMRLGAEQENDATLARFRSDFAEFCLQRLKSHEKASNASSCLTDTDMTEPSAIWRQCYVRAIRELRINPGNRGHHTLHWASQHDPSPEVRDAARVAYKEVINHVNLQEGRSPRAAIFAAYWWLRQAHLHALDRPIDPDGAQRTRIKELRRTQDAELSARLTRENIHH
jgi:hypothetical protein